MRIKLQQAYCIHSRRYRETSRIVELLTLDHGIVSCVHRGAIRNNSSVDFLFMPLLVSWGGKGSLYTLTNIESISSKQITFPEKNILGIYLNEIILRLVPRSSPSAEIYDLYKNVVSLLDSAENYEKLLRLFEVELLSIIGHGLFLDKEIDHETPIKKDCIYRYDVGLGPSKVKHGSAAWNIVKGTTLLALQSPLNMDSASLSEAKHLMRGIIRCHLGSRSLHSREILQFMRA